LRKANHQDRRVRRTQKQIREAFLLLIEEKEYDQITVTDIITKADYNRTTFYRHYYDKEDLANKIIDRQIELFTEALLHPYRTSKILNIDEISSDEVIIFDHIIKHKDFYRLWDRLKSIPSFSYKYTNAIKKILNEKIEVIGSSNGSINRNLYMQFYGYGLSGLIFNWIGSGFEQPPEYMAQQLTKILKSKPIKAMYIGDD